MLCLYLQCQPLKVGKKNMKEEKAKKIQKIFNWVRFIILVLFFTFVYIGLSKAQTTHDFGMWTSAGMEKRLNERWKNAYGFRNDV